MNDFIASEELETLPAGFVQQINDLPETATVCIRKQLQVPEGWVIISETFIDDAPEAWPNAWIIKRPACWGQIFSL